MGTFPQNQIKENSRDSISTEGQTEVEAKLGPSSDSDYKTSESPVHTDDAKPEVPSLLTVQQDEVWYCLLPPAYEVRREGNVFTGVCLFTGEKGGGCPSLWFQVSSLPLVPGPFWGIPQSLVPSPFPRVEGVPQSGPRSGVPHRTTTGEGVPQSGP